MNFITVYSHTVYTVNQTNAYSEDNYIVLTKKKKNEKDACGVSFY